MIHMNEHEAQREWCSYCNSFGIATAIENAAAMSVPDVMFCCAGFMMWMETKLLYNEKYIYIPPFQHAYSIRISHQIHEHQHHFIIYDPVKEVFNISTLKQIRGCPEHVSGNKIRCDVSQLVPVFQVKNKDDFKKYLDYLEEKHFG